MGKVLSQDLRDEIMGFGLILSDISDTLVWKDSTSGSFSIKSA